MTTDYNGESPPDVQVTLTVPILSPTDDTLTAALAYAAAGLYVLPVKMSTKHPGSVVGKSWQSKSSRDPRQLAAWFAGTDYGIAAHMGRSGVIAFDVDNPERLSAVLLEAIRATAPPYQSTRLDVPGRGHYLFTMPPGRKLGNGVGQLGGAWGEVRGHNGIVIVAPSSHENAAEGGRYLWQTTGPLQVLPAAVADLLVDAGDEVDAATDAEVEAFLDTYNEAARPELLDILLSVFANKVAAGESRHMRMVSIAAGAMKEARAGFTDARKAAELLEAAFVAAVAQAPFGKQGNARTGSQARAEWSGILAWTVAVAMAADLEAVRQRVSREAPDADAWTADIDAAYAAAQADDDTGEEAGEEEHDDQAGRDEYSDIRDRFPRLDLAALLEADRPPREWVVHGLIPAGASVAVVAPAGTGKSLLVLACMIAVARGDRSFAGLPITHRRVLLVDMENTADDLADRLTSLGIRPEDVDQLDQLVPIHLPPLAPLDTANGGKELAGILDAYGVRAGDVLVLDSLQRVIDGAENDSDTMRAYYRHTAVMLKRRGLTVVRCDNTGKDADKGARGTSGKRDDVDIELVLVPDAERAGRFRIKPGKVRLPGIAPVVMESSTDEDGRLTYSTYGDPFRAAVNDAVTLLDKLEVPLDTGERPAAGRLKAGGYKVSREALRAALKERRLL